LIYLLKVQGRMSDIQQGDIVLINAEKSTNFGSIMHFNHSVTLVPRMHMVVISKRESTTRMTWLLPEEAWAFMGAPLNEVMPDSHRALHESFSYADMIVMAGQAFHLQAAMAFAISSLMLRPCRARDEEQG